MSKWDWQSVREDIETYHEMQNLAGFCLDDLLGYAEIMVGEDSEVDFAQVCDAYITDYPDRAAECLALMSTLWATENRA